MLFELTTMVFVDSHGIELTNKPLSQVLPQVKHGTNFVRIWSILRNLHSFLNSDFYAFLFILSATGRVLKMSKSHPVGH